MKANTTDVVQEEAPSLSPKEVQRHIRLLSLATVGEIIRGKNAAAEEEDRIMETIMRALEKTAEATRAWIEIALGNEGIGWKKIENVKEYFAKKLKERDLRLHIHEAQEGSPELWSVMSDKVHIVGEKDIGEQRVMEAIGIRMQEAIEESLSKTRGRITAMNALNMLLKPMEYGLQTGTPEMVEVWEPYDSRGASQLTGQGNKSLKKRNLKAHIRRNTAVIGSLDNIYLPDSGEEMSPPTTLEIFEQIIHEGVNKDVSKFVESFIEGGMELNFKRAQMMLGFDEKTMKTFLVSINKNKLRYFGLKLEYKRGTIVVRRLNGPEHIKGIETLTEEWKIAFLTICKASREEVTERFLRYLLVSEGDADVGQAAVLLGRRKDYIYEMINFLNYKSLSPHGVRISLNSAKTRMRVIEEYSQSGVVLLAEDLMKEGKKKEGQDKKDHVAKDLNDAREDVIVPELSEKSLKILEYARDKIIRKEDGRKLVDILIKHPKGINREDLLKELGMKNGELIKKIQSMNFSVLVSVGHRVRSVRGKVFLINIFFEDDLETLMEKCIERAKTTLAGKEDEVKIEIPELTADDLFILNNAVNKRIRNEKKKKIVNMLVEQQGGIEREEFLRLTGINSADVGDILSDMNKVLGRSGHKIVQGRGRIYIAQVFTEKEIKAEVEALKNKDEAKRRREEEKKRKPVKVERKKVPKRDLKKKREEAKRKKEEEKEKAAEEKAQQLKSARKAKSEPRPKPIKETVPQVVDAAIQREKEHKVCPFDEIAGEELDVEEIEEDLYMPQPTHLPKAMTRESVDNDTLERVRDRIKTLTEIFIVEYVLGEEAISSELRVDNGKYTRVLIILAEIERRIENREQVDQIEVFKVQNRFKRVLSLAY